MIDRCKYTIHYDTEKETEKICSLLDYIETKQSKYTGEPIHYFNLKNLMVKSYPVSKTIRVDNSLITFKHGNNHTDFTYTDLTFTTDYISSIFNKAHTEIFVNPFEFSLTVATPEEPMYYISKFNNIRLKPFFFVPPSYNHSKPLEKICPFLQYTIKSYDVGKWNNIPGNNLRWEITFKKMQKVCEITSRGKITSTDMRDKRFLSDLANFSLQTYRNADKQLIIDYRALKPRQREFVFAGANNEYWVIEKKINRNTAKKKRTDYRRLYKELDKTGNEPYRDLERRLQDKFEFLLNT